MKDYKCPYCLESFKTRMFLLNIHTPKCSTREKYLAKLLTDDEMKIINARVNGEHYDYGKITVPVKGGNMEWKVHKEDDF